MALILDKTLFQHMGAAAGNKNRVITEFQIVAHQEVSLFHHLTVCWMAKLWRKARGVTGEIVNVAQLLLARFTAARIQLRAVSSVTGQIGS